MDVVKGLDEAIGKLQELQIARAMCDGRENMGNLFRALGKFVEEGIDDIVEWIAEARTVIVDSIQTEQELREAISGLEQENAELRERAKELEAVVLDVPEERTA